jgi:hypothetical protein
MEFEILRETQVKGHFISNISRTWYELFSSVISKKVLLETSIIALHRRRCCCALPCRKFYFVYIALLKLNQFVFMWISFRDISLLFMCTVAAVDELEQVSLEKTLCTLISEAPDLSLDRLICCRKLCSFYFSVSQVKYRNSVYYRLRSPSKLFPGYKSSAYFIRCRVILVILTAPLKSEEEGSIKDR